MRKLLSISLICLCCWATMAGIANAKLYLSLYATGGEHSFASEQDLDSDPLTGFKISLDYEGGKYSNDFSLEGTYNQFSATNNIDQSSLDATVARVDVIYPLLQETKWRPFLTVGIGRLYFDGNDNKPDDEDIVAYGLGLKYLLNEYLTLRAEARHELLFNREDGNIDNYEYTAGIGYTFGKRKPSKKKPKLKPAPEPEPESTPEPKITDDDDLDGVKNPVDRCPGTPAGIKVDSKGCAGQTPDTLTEPLVEEFIPVDESTPAEETIIVVAKPTAVTEPQPMQERLVIEQEEAPAAYVLPALPTVIAIPTIPEEKQTLKAPVAPPVVVAEVPGHAQETATPATSEPQTPEPDTPVVAVTEIEQTAPTAAMESETITATAQQPVPLAAPPTTDTSETLAIADAADAASAATQESSALPAEGQLPEPLPVPVIAAVSEQTPVEEPPAVAITETEPATAPTIEKPVEPQPEIPATVAAVDTPVKEELETPPVDATDEAATEQALAAAPTGPIAQPAPQASPIAIPECSGLPPHAILMLGKSGSELLHVPVDEIENDPEPYRADTTVAKKSHVPTASFEFDVWQLSPQARQVLSLLVEQLQSSGLNFAIRVEGHTDSKGSDSYNYNLSLLRANAVATFLEEAKGIDPAKLAIAGCGEWKPLASNETDEGRRLNRRFELVVLPADTAR